MITYLLINKIYKNSCEKPHITKSSIRKKERRDRDREREIMDEHRRVYVCSATLRCREAPHFFFGAFASQSLQGYHSLGPPRDTCRLDRASESASRPPARGLVGWWHVGFDVTGNSKLTDGIRVLLFFQILVYEIFIFIFI